MRIKLMATLSLLVLVLANCHEETPDPSFFLEGEVVWVWGTLTSLEVSPEFDGFVSHSNETIRFGDPSFVFGVQTINGVYTIQLDSTDVSGSPGPQTVHNLAAVLKVGTKVRFPTEFHGRETSHYFPIGFSKSKIGILDPDDVELLLE